MRQNHVTGKRFGLVTRGAISQRCKRRENERRAAAAGWDLGRRKQLRHLVPRPCAGDADGLAPGPDSAVAPSLSAALSELVKEFRSLKREFLARQRDKAAAVIAAHKVRALWCTAQSLQPGPWQPPGAPTSSKGVALAQNSLLRLTLCARG
jgi:hypothetical protein